MKPIFKHREAIQLAHDMERNNTYANALIAENKRLREEAERLTPTSSAIMVLQYESDRSELLHKNANLICDNQRLKADVVELRADRNQARLDCAVAESNHMNTLERFLEAQERITELTAERDALLKQSKEPIKAAERGD